MTRSEAVQLAGGFFRDGERHDVAELLACAAARAAEPSSPAPLINTCTDRLEFTITLLTAALSEQPCLLPPSSQDSTIRALQARYPGAVHQPALGVLDDQRGNTRWAVGLDQIGVIGFTSGSTASPTPIPKLWRNLLGASRRLNQACALDDKTYQIVATVPPQHMYGLETSILSALHCGHTVHAGRPMFPADVAAALADLAAPRVLVSTPLHLRAILRSGISLPPLVKIISATAPLDPELARDIERSAGCPLIEIYGSTETGAIASRRTVEQTPWSLFPDVRFASTSEPIIDTEHLPEAPRLPDDIDIIDETHFRLLGRPDNMLKVAGKRYSRDALTAQLLAIAGVEDAVVLAQGQNARVRALVVAPTLSAETIRRQLAQEVDHAFIPRPLALVDRLPRNATGKLNAVELEELIAAQS